MSGVRWTIAVCRTCHRQANWPFCEHKTDGGEWFGLVTVTGKPPEPPTPTARQEPGGGGEERG